MNLHGTKTRLGIETLEARDCPSGLDPLGSSTGQWSWDEVSSVESREAQSNSNEVGVTALSTDSISIPIEQFAGSTTAIPIARFPANFTPARG